MLEHLRTANEAATTKMEVNKTATTKTEVNEAATTETEESQAVSGAGTTRMKVQLAASEAATIKMEESGQVMTKDPKKVTVAKRLQKYNHRKREKLKKAGKSESKYKLTSSHYYGIEAIMAVGALGILCYHVYPKKEMSPR